MDDSPGQPLDYVLFVFFLVMFIPSLIASIYSLYIQGEYPPLHAAQPNLYFLVIFGGLIRAGSSLISFGHFTWSNINCNLWIYWGSTTGVGIYLGSVAASLSRAHRVLSSRKDPYSFSPLWLVLIFWSPFIPFALYGTLNFPYEFNILEQKCFIPETITPPDWYTGIGALLGLGLVLIIITLAIRIRPHKSDYRNANILVFHGFLILLGSITVQFVNFFILNISLLGRFLTSLPPIIIPNMIFWSGLYEPLKYGKNRDLKYEEDFIKNLTPEEIKITSF